MHAFLKCIQLLTIMIILFFFVSTSWYAYILARILSSNNNTVIYDVMFKWRGKTTSNTACHNVIVWTYTLFFKPFINNKIQEIWKISPQNQVMQKVTILELLLAWEGNRSVIKKETTITVQQMHDLGKLIEVHCKLYFI
jgi:hypothetical protein